MSKEQTLLMAVDLGTSFIKAAVYDLKSNLLAQATAPVKSESPSPGVFIQKGDEIMDSVVECMTLTAEKIGGDAKRIEAIAFSGQMSGFMGVDENWNDITNWSCSMDSRYMPYAQRQLEKFGDRIMAVCGTGSPAMGPKYEWYRSEYPERAAKVKKYMVICGFAIGRLSGCSIDDAVIDSSCLEWTGLADLERGEWSDELCALVGIDKKYLPKITHSTDICAYLSPEMAERIGLKAGIPLVSGAGDKVAGCTGANILKPGDAIFEAASYGAISVFLDRFKPDMETKRFDMIPGAMPGQFYALNFIIGSGMTLDWFHKLFADGRPSTSEDFAKLDQLVDQVAPGSEGLMAVGLLGGLGMPVDGAYKGMWMGFDWSHKKEHFYRAMLEAISYEFALVTRRIQEMNPELELQNIKVIGGGAKSRVWTQMNADITGIEYQKLSRDDVALWGAAMMAGKAIGVINDLSEKAAQHIYVKETFVPNMERHKIYQPKMEQYAQYVKGLRPFFAGLQEKM